MSPPTRVNAAEPLLQVRQVNVKYGATTAVQDVSFTVAAGEVVALVGVNGAGKTTTLRALCGAVPLSGGAVLVHGRPLPRTPRGTLRAGIAHCPEGRLVFAHMTVRENLDVGAHTIKDRALVRRRRERMLELFPILEDRQDQKARTLSGGEQQMLAVGRAMMTAPTLLLLDEPTMGLAPIMVKAVTQIIETLRAEGTAILLVEENADLVGSLADTVHLMDGGRIVVTGAGEELAADGAMRRLYLGSGSSLKSQIDRGAQP